MTRFAYESEGVALNFLPLRGGRYTLLGTMEKDPSGRVKRNGCEENEATEPVFERMRAKRADERMAGQEWSERAAGGRDVCEWGRR